MHTQNRQRAVVDSFGEAITRSVRLTDTLTVRTNPSAVLETSFVIAESSTSQGRPGLCVDRFFSRDKVGVYGN